MQKQGKNFICISGTWDHKTQEKMYPFYHQVTYSPLVDSHAFSAFTDFISPKNKIVCRFKAVD